MIPPGDKPRAKAASNRAAAKAPSHRSRRRERQTATSIVTGESGEAKPSTLVKYHVRFLSAKPVRAAFARMVLLSKSQPDEALTSSASRFHRS